MDKHEQQGQEYLATMKTVEFTYDIGDCIHIKDYKDIKGRVVGLCVRVYGTTYCVCWWQDGKRFEEWMHDWEIERCADTDKK